MGRAPAGQLDQADFLERSDPAVAASARQVARRIRHPFACQSSRPTPSSLASAPRPNESSWCWRAGADFRVGPPTRHRFRTRRRSGRLETPDQRVHQVAGPWLPISVVVPKLLVACGRRLYTWKIGAAVSRSRSAAARWGSDRSGSDDPHPEYDWQALAPRQVECDHAPRAEVRNGDVGETTTATLFDRDVTVALTRPLTWRVARSLRRQGRRQSVRDEYNALRCPSSTSFVRSSRSDRCRSDTIRCIDAHVGSCPRAPYASSPRI